MTALFLAYLASRDSLSIRAGLLDDVAHDQNVTSRKLESVLEAGLLSQMREGVALAVRKNGTLR